MLNQRYSDNEVSKRDIPSFIEPRPPLIQNPFMRPRPQKGTNLLELFEDSEVEDPELPDLVQVYLRLKPCKVPNTLYEVRSDKCLVTSLDTATAGHGRRTQHNVSKMYTFSKIFGPQSNQKEIFEDVVKDNLKKLPEGHSFTLLTYGASGSGKTYTLMGTVGAPGLVPRSLEYVFRLVDAAQQPAYKPAENGADKLNYAEQDYELQWVKRLRHISAPLREKYRRMSAQLHCDLTASSIDLSNRVKHYVWVSFVEIYNEAIYDLLAPPDKRTKLRIREDNTGNVYVKGATQAFVRSGEEAYDVMVAGKHNLVVAATGVHANSSRSHCIFTITMLTESGAGEGGPGSLRASCVRLCDLAGCERARATRNTGARMAESRAINSSLHVLERCLHMLRRKQRSGHDALVPYRESKLTRLLGSGLSGARGEAVSMVVTLNPSPEYAHETKHVLTLAAVAQDIQINNTMLLASTLESSTQDTTITSSAEVMKLRSDNERLHFELVQAQARNKELLAAMEEKQQEAANTMRELVEEAKDMTRQYYESQIEALRLQMDEMMEEYESRLEQAKALQPPGGSTTPSKILHTRIAELMTEIAVLEEKLTAETLARARAEKEVQHLRTCIDERDDKEKDMTPVSDISDDSQIESSESEDESDKEPEDPLNQSLEPVFKKEQNRSVVIHDKLHSDSMSVHTIDNIDEEDELELDDSADTVKNDDDTPKKSFVETNSINKSAELLDNNDIRNDNDISKDCYENAENTESVHVKLSIQDNEANISNPEINGLSCDVEMTNDVKDASFKSTKSEFKDTNSTSDTNIIDNDEIAQEMNIKKINMFRGTYCVQDSIADVRKLSIGNDDPIETTNNVSIKANEFEGDKAVQSDNNCSGTLVSQIIKSLQTNQGSDSSLRQFEQLEQAAKDYQESRKNNKSVFGEIKITKEKRTYFDDNITTKEITSTSILEDYAQRKLNTEKRTYFDNIGVPEINSDKVNEIKHMNVERSPSIVKDIVSDQFEPSTIKKLLGERENSIKPDILSAHKIKVVKKHDSVDIFEGFDSPAFIAKVQDKIDNVELARKSIERLVLEQQTKKSKTVEREVITIFPAVLEKDVDQREPVITEDKPKQDLKISSVNSIADVQHEPQQLIANTESSQVDSVIQPKAVKADNALRNKIQEIDVVKLPNKLNLQPVSSLDTPFQKEEAIIKTEIKLEPASSIDEPNQTMNSTQSQTNVNNTIEEFDNIYKDITAPRETEFEMLLSQNQDTSDTDMIVNSKHGDTKETEHKFNNKNKNITLNEVSESKLKTDNQTEEMKYNLRNKRNETTATKRSLRLRRKKNDCGEDTSQEIGDSNPQPKLKDIVNLQSEFSDVTLDIPATKKDVKDIPSPEKYYNENLPPLLGIQSCPSKSITRSRRKLFTPRAEPLEESLSQTGDSNERVYVPRPSYHRPRARRKL